MEPLVDKIDIGLDGKQISGLILGTSTLYTNKNCSAILNAAVEYGVNTFDLAPSHLSNDKVREWMLTFRKKDPETFGKLVFVVKGGFPTEEKQGQYKSQLVGSAEEIARNVQKSLELTLAFYELPKADIFMLHRDDEDYVYNSVVKREKTPVKTIFEATKQLSQFYSICSVSNWEDERALEFASLMGKDKPLVCSSYFSLWERSGKPWHGELSYKHEDLMNPSYLPGCTILPYSPLGGFFGSRISIAGVEEIEKWCDEDGPDAVTQLLMTGRNKLKYARLKDYTEKLNDERMTSFSTLQMTIAYCLAHPRVTSGFTCVDSVEQLENNIRGYILSKSVPLADLDFLNLN